jgi:hydrogenase maturation protease
MTVMNPHVLIIGVGNEFRRDDGVGIAVVRRLQGQTPAGVSILESSGEGAALMQAWAEHPAVFLVDAVDSGVPPGKFIRLEAEQLPSRCLHESTHAFGVAAAVALARALNQLPPRLLVYGIAGKDFCAGVGLSAEAEAGVGAVVGEILSALHRSRF